MLFLRAGRFACRHCQRIAYASQSGDAIDRGWRKQPTRERLLAIIWEREDRRDEAIAGHLMALMGWHPSLAGGV